MKHTANCVLLPLGGACSCGAAGTEMRELAGRMAADEANEGDYTAAAELKSFAEGGPVTMRGEVGPELLFPYRPSSIGHDSGCSLRGDGVRCDCSAAPTGPLTPGQVMCTVCRLDDRTRAATDPNDLRCDECRDAAADSFPPLVLGENVGGPKAIDWTSEPVGVAEDSIPAGGEGTVRLGRHAAQPVPWDLAAFVQAAKDAGATPRMPLPVVGPFAAKHLVAQGAVEGQDYVVTQHPMIADPPIGQGAVGRWKMAEELAGPLADAAAARVSTIDWSVLGPEIVATVQARQHVWDAGTGSLRDCYCVRGADHTEQPLSELQSWMNASNPLPLTDAATRARVRELQTTVDEINALGEDLTEVMNDTDLLIRESTAGVVRELHRRGWRKTGDDRG